MQPNQPPVPPDYNFIMQNQAKRSGPAFLQNQDPRGRKIMAAGFVVVVFILLLVVFNVLFSGGNSSELAIKRIIAQQTEIVRVAKLTTANTRDPAVKNRIATIQAITSSDLQQLSSYARTNGVSISDAELVSAKDSTIDEALDAAQQRGSYDSEAESILDAEFADYQALLATGLNETGSEATKAVLTAIADNTVVFAN